MSTTTPRWFHRRGELARDGWEAVVDATIPGWSHTGLLVADFDGDRRTLDAGGVERILVPLAGSFDVEHARAGTSTRTRLAGRASVFSGPTDVLYLGAGASASVTGHGRLAVATAPASDVRPDRHVAVDDTPVELRGAGSSSRQVHNFGTPESLDASRLIVCEVITPAGNWSSYPPHKHDETVPGHESRLEEIYYFEAAPTRGAPDIGSDDAFGMFSASSSPVGAIEMDIRVCTGDIALVPFGYHGPAAAAPGYDLYYLNVMAGPDPERAWRITDDPRHAWVRAAWHDQRTDPRLPYTQREDRP